MKKITFLLATCLLSVGLLACGGREQETGADAASRDANKPITVKGSDTMVILTQRLAEEFMKVNSGAVVQVNGGGSGTGIAALINGTADLAMASRPMKDDEKQKAAQNRGSDPTELAIALDGLGVFVNSANSVQQLTIAQLRDIFQGKVKNWNAVGGKDATIILYGRESSSGTYDYFREHVLDKGDFAPAVQTLQGTAAIINAIGADPNGIGYGGIAYAKDVRALAVSSEGGAAVAPSEKTVADGSYPLSRKLFFYYPSAAPERVTKFAQWVLTPEAQALVTEVGYFPLNATSDTGATTETGTSTETTGTGDAATATTQTR